MERSILGTILSSFVGISALVGLALLGASPHPVPGKAEGNWHLLDPVSYENLMTRSMIHLTARAP